MFEHACIRRQWSHDPDVPFDLGFLAEALLYYGRVDVVASASEVKSLVRAIGPETILELMREGFLGITYTSVLSGIQGSGGSPRVHQYVNMSSPRLSLENVSIEAFSESCGRKGRGRRMGLSFLKLAQSNANDSTLRGAVADDFRDATFIRSAVEQFLRAALPSFHVPADFRFQLIEASPAAFVVDSNLDFAMITDEWCKSRPGSDVSVSAAWILVHVAEVRENLMWASQFSADLAIDPVSAAVGQLKMETLLTKSAVAARSIHGFEGAVFDKGSTVGDVIRTGERNFGDLLKLLQEAREFKKWLAKLDGDCTLIREYLRDVTKVGWAERLPTKTLRWVLMTAAGCALGSVGGGSLALALSAADQFLLDRLIGGWRPGQFVNGPLLKFSSVRRE